VNCTLDMTYDGENGLVNCVTIICVVLKCEMYYLCPMKKTTDWKSHGEMNFNDVSISALVQTSPASTDDVERQRQY